MVMADRGEKEEKRGSAQRGKIEKKIKCVCVCVCGEGGRWRVGVGGGGSPALIGKGFR